MSLIFNNVSKSYPVYENSVSRIKELAFFGRRNFHKDFWALRDCSFEVTRGSTFCLVGENGSGKSTALQLAAGIFSPTRGQIDVKGRVSSLLELGAGFNPEFSGRENVFLNGAILGLSTQEIRHSFRKITDFAEIGEFIDQPVRTYSSGMLVRLAFAVAIHVEPEILLVDEALAVGDYYFRQRCMRKIHEMRRRNVTVVFVSHSMADVKAIGTQALWLERGHIMEIGDPAPVISKYLAHLSKKDATYVDLHKTEAGMDRGLEPSIAPEIVETIPNIDFRHGNRRAEILGINVINPYGQTINSLEPHIRLRVRISVRARKPLTSPNIGFILRNHLGVDFAGVNTASEGIEVPAMSPGDIHTVDFSFVVPELQSDHFSFTPAVANGPLDGYETCDWIDNALTLPMEHGDNPIYGYIRLPTKIEINTRLIDSNEGVSAVSSCKE